MIIAYSKTFPNGVHVDGPVNRGGWFGKTWLVLIGTGFDPLRLVVEADHESDAVDYVVDSKWGFHLKDDAEPCEACQEVLLMEEAALEAGQEVDYETIRPYRDNCTCEFAGNNGERVDMYRLSVIERCKVDYFVKKEKQYDFT